MIIANAPIQVYASGKVNVYPPYAIDPVANLKVKALNGGIAVTFAKSPMDTWVLRLRCYYPRRIFSR